MVKLPNGRSNKHVDESKGADNNVMKFYITEYSSKHGVDGFIPRPGTKTGTGYQSNFRPGVYYSRKLDELDNPTMGKIVNDNYVSMTHKNYQRWKGSPGNDPFRKGLTIRPSGFVINDKRTLPSYNDVYYPKSAPAAIRSFRTSDIDQNFISENHSQFIQRGTLVNTYGKTVGPKEGTGFTHEKNLEPITYRPDECHDGSLPPVLTNRPIGRSVMKSSFLPPQNPIGSERLCSVNEKAVRDDGFTRFIQPTAALTGSKKDAYSSLGDLHPTNQQKLKKEDPCEYLNYLYPQQYLSTKQATFQGKQTADLLNDKMNNITIGEKEDTGYSSNNKGYSRIPDDIRQFSTIYTNQFIDKNDILKSRHEKAYKDGVLALNDDGYTKNEKVHSMGENIDCEQAFSNIAKLHPYVNRSLKARDPFYGEQIHKHKQLLKSC